MSLVPAAIRPLALPGQGPVVLAFVGVALLGGGNAVAVRISDEELAPLWGATLRLAVAAVVLLAVVGLTRTPIPRGRAFAGSVLYGAVGFAGAFGLLYWALVRVPAASGQLILALVPLLTFLFAVGQGLEPFRSRGLLGAVLAFAGVTVVVGDRLGASVPFASLAAVVGGAACMAESNVIVKLYPRCHPMANNAVAMATAAVLLFVASALLGEPRSLPAEGRTLAALGYVSLVGTVGVFSLFLYIVGRWSASATSYVMLLMPLVTIAIAGLVNGEMVSTGFLAGGALVLVGVFVGATGRAGRRAPGGAAGEPFGAAPAARGPANLQPQPGCA